MTCFILATETSVKLAPTSTVATLEVLATSTI